MVGLVLLAIAPGLALFLFFYLRDRYRKEPTSALLVTFLLGAAALIPAYVTSLSLEKLTGWRSSTDNVLHALLGALFIVGLVEETAKYVVVRFYAYHRREFDAPYDGILYSVVAALGFATVENVFYVVSHGAGAGVLRAFIAVPGHAFDGVLMGFFLGAAKFAATDRRSNLLSALGLALAVLAHGLYDWMVFSIDSAPLMIVCLLVFALLTWVIIFKATRHHAEASPYRQPGLADLHRHGVVAVTLPGQPVGDVLSAIAAHDRVRPASGFRSAVPMACAEPVVGDAETAVTTAGTDVVTDGCEPGASVVSADAPAPEPDEPDTRPRS
ncbi:MAG: PrsW family glutamic-type intramembrane protease [bacterium]